MAGEATKIVGLRNSFYRDSQHRIQIALLMSILVNVGLGLILGYMITHPPEPKYFATSIDGRYTPIIPLNQPNQSVSAVLNWANQAAVAAYTYEWVHYRTDLMAASEFFTAAGWDNFLTELERSNNLNRVKASKMVVSAVATRTPTLLSQGITTDGRYFWRVQMQILVTFESASTYSQDRYNVIMQIVRVSTLNTPSGIGIAQFIVEPAGGGLV
jgi:intracellular multiplication protein IcmL